MDPLKTGLIFSLKPIGSQQPPARPVNKPQSSSIPIVPSVSSSYLAQPTPGNEGFVEPKLPIAVKTSLQDSFERLYRQTPLPAVLAGGMQTITASVPAYRLSAPFTNLNSITKKIDYGEHSVTETPFQIPLPPMQEDFPTRNEEVRAQAAPATAYRMSAPPGGLAQEQLMIPEMHPFMPSIAISTPALQRTAEIAHAIQVENIYHQVMEKFRQNDRFIQSTQTPKHTFATQSKSRTVGSQTKLEDKERTQQSQNLPPHSNYSTKRSETKSIGVAATSYSPPHSDHQDDYPDYPTFEYDLPPSPPPIIEKEKPRTRPQVMSSSGMSSGSSYLAVTGSSSEQDLNRRSPQKAKSSSAVIDRRRTPGTSVTSSSLVALAESSSEQDRRALKFPPRSAQRTPLERTRAPSSSIRQSQKNSLTDIVDDSSEQEALYSTDKFSSQRQHSQSSVSQQRSPHKSPQREISVINNHTITASSSLSGLRNEKKQVASSSSSSLASIADVGKPSTPTTYSISASKAPSSAEKKRIQPQLISVGKSDLLNVSISPATASRPAPTVRTRAPAQSRPAYTAPSSQSFVMDSLLSLGGDPVPQRPRSNPNTSVDVRARGMPISAASTESIRPRHKAQYEENNSLLSIAPSNVPQRAVPSSSSATTARQRVTTTSSSNSNNNRTSYNPFELTSDQETLQSKPTQKSSSQSSRPRYGDEGESLGEESEANIGKRSVSSSKRRETSQYNLKDAGDDDIPFTTSSFLDSRTFSSPKPDSIASNGRIAKSLDKSLREAESLPAPRSNQKTLPTSPLVSSSLAPIASPSISKISSGTKQPSLPAPAIPTEQPNKPIKGRPKKNKALLSDPETDDVVPAPKKARKTTTTNNNNATAANKTTNNKDNKNSEANFFRDISEGLFKLSQEHNSSNNDDRGATNKTSNGNNTNNATGNKKSADWKPAERVALYKLFAETNLTEPNFWEIISNGLKAKGFNRSKEECEHTWFSQVKVAEERKKSNAEKKKETQINNTLNKVQTIQQQKEAAEMEKKKTILSDEENDNNLKEDEKEKEKEKKRRLGKKDLQILAEQSSKAVKEDDYYETFEYKRQQLLKQKQQQQQQQQQQKEKANESNQKGGGEEEEGENPEEKSEDTIEQQSPKKSSIPPPPPGTPPPLSSSSSQPKETPKISSSQRIGESSEEDDDDTDRDEKNNEVEKEMENYNPFDPPKDKKKPTPNNSTKKTIASPARDRSSFSVLEFTNSILTSLAESISSPTTVSPMKLSNNNNNNRRSGRTATGRSNLAETGAGDDDDNHHENEDDQDEPSNKRKRLNNNNNNTATANNPTNRYQGSSLFLSLSQQSSTANGGVGSGMDLEEEKLFENTHVHKIARGNPKSILLSTQQRAKAAEKGFSLTSLSQNPLEDIDQVKSSNQEFVTTMKKSLNEIGQLKKRKRVNEDFLEDVEEESVDEDDDEEEEGEEGEGEEE